MTQQNFTVDTGLTVAGTGGNITGATNIEAANSIIANAVVVNGTAGDITLTGGNILGANAVVANTITSSNDIGVTASSSTWTFDTNGILTLPGEGVLQSTDDTVTLSSFNTSTNYANGVYVGTSGGLGFFDNSIPANWLEIFRNGTNPQIGTLGNLQILANSTGSAPTWVFDSAGNLTLPAGTPSINYSNGSPYGGGGSGPNLQNYGNYISIDGEGYGLTVDAAGEHRFGFIKYFGMEGALAYANTTPFKIGRVANANVLNGSNTTFTTTMYFSSNGNIGVNNEAPTVQLDVTGDIKSSGNVLGNGYASFSGTFDESQASTAGLYLGYAGGTPRMMFGTGNTLQTFEIDNDGGNLRFYQPGSTKATLTAGGLFSATGNVVGANIVTTGNVVGNVNGYSIGYLNIPQVSFTGNATISATDAGKHYYSTLSTANTLTIANNTSVSWEVGTAITIVNRGTGNISIAQDSGVSLYLAGNSTATNRTVTTYGMATIMNVAANVWMINGTGVV